MNKKTLLLVVGILVIAMGVMALIPSLGMGTEPIWHTIAKLVLGVAAVYVALTREGAIKTTSLIVGVVLAAMGLLGLLLNVNGFSAPTWHSIAVIVVGVVTALIGGR
ncbi:MAG TPA: hypothetical protein PLX92_04380 [Anaerolineaceae bacterium]|nr:hypothetical protein [Anaerolineaceae bacterium]HUM49428.1 hypothetical protein [Anaerolineaceae bacterium]